LEEKMTENVKEQIRDNIQVFKKGNVSFYLSAEAKAKLDRISFNLTGSQRGRGITLETMIDFCNTYYINMEAWYENARKVGK
jgi:hypothetical protein